jgi:integrase
MSGRYRSRDPKSPFGLLPTLSAGENPKVVSERLGHANIVLTLDTYSHILPTMQKAATEKIEKMMFGT